MVTHYCGHGEHTTKIVHTQPGFDIHIFDWRKYGQRIGSMKDLIAGIGGVYCPGQDAVSEVIDATGTWEVRETALATEALRAGNRHNLVLDFGSQIGWYSLIAAGLGYSVIAFDAEEEYNRLHRLSLDLNHFSNVNILSVWVDKNSEPVPHDEIELFKADIEGYEPEIVQVYQDAFKTRRVKTALLEISPTLAAGYPEMVSFIQSCGYNAYDIGGDTLTYVEDACAHLAPIKQTNFVFKVKDV